VKSSFGSSFRIRCRKEVMRSTNDMRDFHGSSKQD
jgi:hypothetical protein